MAINKIEIAKISTLEENQPTHALIKNTDLVMSAKQLHNYFDATNNLIRVIARSCGYDDISKFNHNDLSTFDRDMHK